MNFNRSVFHPIQTFRNALNDRLDDINDIENRCQDLSDDGYLSDKEAAKEQVIK